MLTTQTTMDKIFGKSKTHCCTHNRINYQPKCINAKTNGMNEHKKIQQQFNGINAKTLFYTIKIWIHINSLQIHQTTLKMEINNNNNSFSEASRRFMMRTCNGLELRDQIPPLPPEIALSNLDSSLLLDHHIMNICER